MTEPRRWRELLPNGVRDRVDAALEIGELFTEMRNPAVMRSIAPSAVQWNATTYLPWQTPVDPLDPDKPIIPEDFLDRATAERVGIKLDAARQRELLHSFACWALSQFSSCTPGAPYAAAQVTESRLPAPAMHAS